MTRYTLEKVRAYARDPEPEYVVEKAVEFVGTETSATNVLAPPRAWAGWGGQPPRENDRLVTPHGATRIVNVLDVGPSGLQVSYHDVRY